MRIPVNPLVYSKPYGPGCEGDHFWPRKPWIPSFYGISWKLVKIMIFMEKCESHIKSTRKQPSAPEAENSSNSYAFLHGSEAVRVLLEPGWWNSPNSTYFSGIPPFWWNFVKFGDFWCLGGGNLAFTRSSMKTKPILGLFRRSSRPDRYFSLNSTHFRWFSVKSPKMVEI